MLRSVACECGKQMRVNENLAGKRVKCPACGRAVVVDQGVTYSVTAPATETAESARICPGCGATQPHDAFVCILCKAALPAGKVVSKSEAKKEKLTQAKKAQKDEETDLRVWQRLIFGMPVAAVAGAVGVGLAMHLIEGPPWAFPKGAVAVFFCWALTCSFYFHNFAIGTLRRKAAAAKIESVGRRWRRLDYWSAILIGVSLLLIIATLLLVAPSRAWEVAEEQPKAKQRP